MSSSIGPNFSRVVFLDRMEEVDYLGLLAQCSVVLDTIHYGGGANTIYDAIQAGIPVITLEGNRHSARFAAAALKQLNLLDTITSSSPEYIEKAVSISNDKAQRNTIIQKIKKGSAAIFEDMEAVRELEDFYIDILNKC